MKSAKNHMSVIVSQITGKTTEQINSLFGQTTKDI